MFLVGPGQSLIQGVYTQHFGLKLADLATIVLVCRIFDAITDPTIGFISDRTRDTLPGGRKFFVVLGAVVSVVAVYFLFIPSSVPVSSGYFFAWFLLSYLGWTLIEIPHLSWGSELTKDYQGRSTIFTYRTTFYYLGYMAFLALPLLPLVGTDGYTPETLEVAFWVVAITFPLTVYACCRYCPKGEVTKTQHTSNMFHALRSLKWNKPARVFTSIFLLVGLAGGMQTGIAFLYITSFLGLHSEAPLVLILSFPFALVGLPVWLWISKKIGKHIALFVGVFLTAISFYALTLLESGPNLFWEFLVLNSIIHFLQSSWISVGPSMLGDIVDYDESVTGEENGATYFAYFTFIRKVFEGIGGGLGLYIAARYGFDPANLVINTDVVFSMHLVMGFLPCVMMFVAAFLALRSPITKDVHARIVEKIKRPSVDNYK